MSYPPGYCPECGVRSDSFQHHCPPSEGALEVPEAKQLQLAVRGKARIGYEHGQFFFYFPGYYSVHEDDGTIDSNREVWTSPLKRYIGTSVEEARQFIHERQL